jgi:DNA gyrase subunit A
MITAWIGHRIEVIRRRTRYELEKAEARAHILEGYLKALDNLDAVVKLIRSSASRQEAKEGLTSQFDFTDKQAHAVLDLRLYQLTGLELDKIQGEYDELLEKIRYYKAVLADEKMVRDIIKQDIEDLMTFHKPKRRTQIVAAEGEFNMEDLLANDPVVISISDGDYIKRMPIETFREQRRGGQGVSGAELKRDGDTIKSVYSANMHDYLLIFTSFGRCYWLKVWQIPEGSRKAKGKAIVNLLEGLQDDEHITTVLRVPSFEEEGAYILLTTRGGIVKKTDLTAFSNPRRKGIYAITLEESDAVVGAHIVQEGQQVMLFTKKGMAVRFDQDAVRSMGRIARGVKGVSLKTDDDLVVGSEVVSGEETIFVVCENGYGKRSKVEDFRQTNRGAGGVKSIIINERNGDVVGAVSVADEDGMLLMSHMGQTLRLPVASARVMGRNTQGVCLVNLKNAEDRLVAIQKLEAAFEEEAEASDVTDAEESTPEAKQEVEE